MFSVTYEGHRRIVESFFITLGKDYKEVGADSAEGEDEGEEY